MDIDKCTIVIDFEDLSIEKAEAQIRTLKYHIQKLSAKRNALLPINRLPADVLLDIFALVGKRPEKGTGRSLLDLTCVSHDWRELVLGAPTLWTIITSSNLVWAEEWLARSGLAPLSIGLLDMEKDFVLASMSHFQSVLAHIPRMKALHCTLSEFEEFSLKLSSRLWVEPAFLLTSLKLERWHLPENFFNSVPNVENMSLKTCQFSWNIDANYPHLTFLHICEPVSTVPVRDFVDLLKGIPSLQRLVLAEVFSLHGDSDTFLPSPTSVSPRLHVLKLNFNEAIDSSLQFLRCALPCFTTDQTIISCSSDLADLEDDRLPHLLSAFSQTVSPKQVATIKYTHPELPNSSATLYINYQGADSESDIYRTTLEIGIDEEQSRTLLATLQETLALGHVKAVKFGIHANDLDGGRLVEIFGGLPKLQYFDFRAHYPEVFDFLDALKPADDGISPPPFASLKVLGSILAEEVDDRLVEVLSKRRHLGYGLDTVVVGDYCIRAWEGGTLPRLGDLVNHIPEELGPEALEIERAFFTGAESVACGFDMIPFEDD
ncbi:hypothetical protein BDN72DRAFT_904416 [Pluteus cervinus]|uniref:Uncharacterized protein n=1 Tax=Pluteus cervinus TaxID=181527 RepID=A0ACD3A5V3_9AGAR|nr:hypothetical protein BDN72DRAFT_904416 [Pluteus cervinus]